MPQGSTLPPPVAACSRWLCLVVVAVAAQGALAEGARPFRSRFGMTASPRLLSLRLVLGGLGLPMALGVAAERLPFTRARRSSQLQEGVEGEMRTRHIAPPAAMLGFRVVMLAAASLSLLQLPTPAEEVERREHLAQLPLATPPRIRLHPRGQRWCQLLPAAAAASADSPMPVELLHKVVLGGGAEDQAAPKIGMAAAGGGATTAGAGVPLERPLTFLGQAVAADRATSTPPFLRTGAALQCLVAARCSSQAPTAR